MSGNTLVTKSMRLEKSDDSSFFFQAGVLSILCLVIARTDGLRGGLTGGVDEIKGGSLTDIYGDDVDCP